MIVTHPEIDRREEQESLLEALPQNKRKRQDLVFSYSNAVYRYHKQSAGEVIPSLEDYYAWLKELSDTLREKVESSGYHMSMRLPMLIQFSKERNKKDLESFVRDLMGKDNYLQYQSFLAENFR